MRTARLPTCRELRNAAGYRWRDTNGNETLDETLYYTNDANMNVTALVDTGGQVVERYKYDPYGKPTYLHGADPGGDAEEWDVNDDLVYSSAVDNCVLYAGYVWDPKVGLFHVRNRTYHPILGRWLQRDPKGYTGGSNLYGYSHGSPPVHTDPFGLTPWTSRRSTESVQEIVGASVDGLYGPETCGKVRTYQGMLKRRGYLGETTVSGRGSVDGKWGDQTEDAYLWYLRCARLKCQREYWAKSGNANNIAAMRYLSLYSNNVDTFLLAEGFRQVGTFTLAGDMWDHLPNLSEMSDKAWQHVEEEIESLWFRKNEVIIPAAEASEVVVHAKNAFRNGLTRPHALQIGVGVGIMVGHIAADHLAHARQHERLEILWEIAGYYAESSALAKRDLVYAEAFDAIIQEDCPNEDQ